MLLTFKTQAYSDITMFADVAMRFLKMMGQSSNVPGAILAADLPAALAALEARLAEEPERQSEPVAEVTEGIELNVESDNEAVDAPVGVWRQAFPLIELLKAAIAKNKDVLWEANSV